MSENRERRSRGRKKVRYEEVLPSTDLPPLVQGDLRCFLIVDIGKIIWSSTATAQVPPASPAYVRLRWWGETSDGTLFKPASSKTERVVKSRCRFGVRSGAKQMSAYFVDMGSIVLEVLTSPKSAALGRIQIPKVASISSDNPIRDSFPIISPSSRKIGELHISVRFRPLEAAYDLTTDTGTDTSMSSRSRPPSEIGRCSRSRGSSIGSRSNIGSARSRSSSAGSHKGSKSRKSKSRSKGRGRSHSIESNGSSVSSRKSKKKDGSVDSFTPRGIDDLLRRNGQNLYGIDGEQAEDRAPKKSSMRKPATPVDHIDLSTSGQDAISALLKRGNKLREDVMKSQFDSVPTSSRYEREIVNVPQPTIQPVPEIPTNPASYRLVPNIQTIPKTMTPVKEQRNDLDMRFVDLVFGSQEFKGHPSFLSSCETPPLGSPLSSMISEFEDNPLHDDSLLQQLFYSNGPTLTAQDRERVAEKLRELEQMRQKEAEDATREVHFSPKQKPRSPSPRREASSDRRLRKLADRIPGMSLRRLQLLQKVQFMRVVIETINMAKPRSKKGRGRGSKPPMPSPLGQRKQGTYFVEFRFPVASGNQREHPSSMTTSHEVTRVASRRQLNSEGTSIAFDESCEFQIKFDEDMLVKWSKDNLEFVVHCRKPSDKKPMPLGVAMIPLQRIIETEDPTLAFDLEITENYKSRGTLKVSIEKVCDDSSEKSDDDVMSPRQQMTSQQDTEMKEIFCADDEHERIEGRESEIQKQPDQGSSIALSPLTSVLYMMLMVQEGIDIPGMTVISPTHGVSSHPPNVSLVCRTLTSGESEKTPVVWGESNPKFDFVQISPLKLDNSLLTRTQNNFVIIEVWTKVTSTQPHSDKLLGLVKLPTHHFYQSLKDEEISNVVLKSQHPLVSTDEPTPIIDVFTGQERGKLQVTLALGTQTQISTLKKIKSNLQKPRPKQHHLEAEKPDESTHKMAGPVEHVFEINVVKLDGFKPVDNQSWGETDCFIQYQFPKQKSCDESDTEGRKEQTDEEDDAPQRLNLAAMQSCRSDSTLCVPDPVFNDACRHMFRPPPSVPVQRILLSCCYGDGLSGGIPFELWSRYYHPNVRDQLLAKGMLPVAKIGALVTMTTKKVSEQTFHIPMEFVDPERSCDKSAGRLEVHIKYRASGTTFESTQPTIQFKKPVILRVGLLRACGLKAAAVLASRHSNEDIMKYHADVGVNSYVQMKPTFLPDEDARTSRVVAQSFAPEYQHHVELACPLVSYHSDITPVSLAELLVSGEMEFTIWHRHTEKNGSSQNEDVLLATLVIPMRSLLRKTNGFHSWFPLKPPELSQRSSEGTTVGALEISMTFTHSNDLDLILRAGRETGWSLPHFESRLLSNDVRPIDDITKTDQVTFSVTVTNAWLPKHEILLHGRTIIDQNANVYLRYKFYDHDSVTSSLVPLVAKQPHSIDSRFENLTSARIAHKRSFVCKRSRALTWFLREEQLEIQIWLTHSKGAKSSRPLNSDKLLGSCHLDLSTIGDLSREQHISGSFDLVKAGADDLGGGKVRVYVSMKPGAIADPIPDPLPLQIEEVSDENEEKEAEPQGRVKPSNPALFPAVVTVERAMHLPLVGDLETGAQIRPNCFVSYDVVEESVAISNEEEELPMVTVATKIITETPCPIWNDVKEVCCPRQLLTGTHGALLLKVWHRDTMYIQADKPAESAAACGVMATDRMLGFATVDLSIFRAGFRDLNGWYNVLDIHGQCQGQLKVAVTPVKVTDVTPRSSDKKTLINTDALVGLKGGNFLHPAPIDVPVQTPSGSMYFPGLRSSAQTVGTTCKMTKSEEDEFHRFHDNTQNILPKFPPPFQQPQNMPSTSMFRYSSSDKQQACLVNTLQKQIKELEEIKKRFEHRRASGFIQNPHEDEKQNISKSQNQFEIKNTHEDEMQNSSSDTSKSKSSIGHEGGMQKVSSDNSKLMIENVHEDELQNISSDNDEASVEEPRSIGVTVLNLHPNRTKSFDALPDLELVRHNESETRVDSPETKSKSSISSQFSSEIQSNSENHQSKSVHLSLCQRPKNREFNEGALSDNEANSDLEFIQPRSLNYEPSDNVKPPKSTEVKNQMNDLEPTKDKPPHVRQSTSDPYPSALPTLTPSGVPLTPGRSEGHSVLEDTSLWLSGSTLRVSGFSSDDECESSKVTPRSKDEDDLDFNVTPRSNIENELDPQGTGQKSNQVQEFDQSEESSDEEERSEDSKKQEERCRGRNEQQIASQTTEEIQELKINPELNENSSGKGQNSTLNQGIEGNSEITEYPESKINEKDMKQLEESLPGSDGEIPVLSMDEQRGQGSKVEDDLPLGSKFNRSIPDEEEVTQPAIQQAEREPADPAQAKLAAARLAKTNSTDETIDRHTCPNMDTEEQKSNVEGQKSHSQGQKSAFPSFFPPSRNLEASMRALQEATEKHKHRLLKQKKESTEVKDNVDSSSPSTGITKQPRTKKLPQRPTDYSDERTKRLARIFGTKFS